jgi:hypothetical protein
MTTEFKLNPVVGELDLVLDATAIDHGGLTGLSDDDHTQYILADGTRAFTGTVTGVAPSADLHLATKKYVDDNAGGYTNLTSFVDQTAWRVFYSNTDGDVTELALGADGTFLKSNGATSAPSFATPAGSGDVSKVGTPVDDQVGVWTGDGTIEGTANFTYDGTDLNVKGQDIDVVVTETDSDLTTRLNKTDTSSVGQRFNEIDTTSAGYGLDFDGDNDYIDLGSITSSDDLCLNGTNFTISVWLKPTFSGMDNSCRIIDKSSGGSVANGWGCWLGTNGSAAIGAAGSWYTSAASLITGNGSTWNHVVFRSKGSAWEVWVNGVKDTGGSYTGSWTHPPSNTTNARIGSWNHSTGREYKGVMDQLVVWKTDIADSDITDLYNSGNGVYVSTSESFATSTTSMGSNMASLWNMNEGTGTNVADDSTNSIDGTMTNMAAEDWVTGHIDVPSTSEYNVWKHEDGEILTLGTATTTQKILGSSVGIDQTSPVAKLDILADTTDQVTQLMKLAGSQTADAFVINNSSDTELFSIDKDGNIDGEDITGSTITGTAFSGGTFSGTTGTFSSTVQAEHLYSTDDAVIDDALSVGGNLTTALTQNSIPFIGTAGLLTEDTTNLVWDDTNNRIGVGTNSPGAVVDVLIDNSGEVGQIIKGAVSQSADLLRLTDSGDNKAFFVHPDGYTAVNTDSHQTTVNGSTINNMLLVRNDALVNYGDITAWKVGTTATKGARWGTYRARTSEAALADGDYIGEFAFFGHDGTDYQWASRIHSEVDGTVSANTVPMALVFTTSQTNSTGLTERMRITADGDVGIGDNDPGARLHVVPGSSKALILEDGNNDLINIDSSAGAGGDMLRFTTDGELTIGVVSPDTTVNGTTIENKILVRNDDSVNYGDITIEKQATGGNGPRWGTYRSRASGTAVADGDTIGEFDFFGHDGTDYEWSARFRAVVDGTVSANKVPMALVFESSDDNSSSLTEAMRLSSNGNVGFNVTDPDERLEMNGWLKAFAASPATYNGIIFGSDGGFVGALAAGATSSAFFFEDAGNFGIRKDTRANILAKTGVGTELLTITPSGNIGINQSSPNAQAGIHMTDVGDLWMVDSTQDIRIVIGEGINANQYGVVQWDRTNNWLEFYTQASGADAFRIDGSGELSMPQDSKKFYWGAGKDVSISYDGTDMKIITDEVAASDLVIDCGTQKTIELAEVVWDDLVINPSALRLPASNPPSTQAYKGGQVLSFEDNGGDDVIYFNAQLPHTYKEGTDIKFHVHWTIDTNGSAGGAENVKWDLTYSWVNANGSFPAESSGTVTVDVQNDSADDHMIDGVATLTGTGKTVSSVLICSLTRDTSVANNYGGHAYLLSADFHHEIDTMGSRQEFTK